MKSSTRIYALLGIVVLVLVGWAVFFYFVSPELIIDKIGIKNTYLAAFILSSVAGFSSITGTSVYATLAAFAHGGANPLILGTVSGLGLFLSDSLFYFLASYGHTMITKTMAKWDTAFKKMRRWTRIAPDWLVFTVVYLYSAFAPVPNDLLLVVLVVSGYSYRQFAPYLLLGDLTGALVLAYVAGSLS